MKTTILLLFAMTLSAHAQICNRLVTAFNAAPGGYAINGTALLLDNNGILTLYLDSAFSTTAGPDLHVYLAANFDAPTSAGNPNIVVAPLQSSSGQQSFAVPAGISLTDYNYVLIHCLQFNHFWGGGLLGQVDCPAGIEETTFTSLNSFYRSGYIYFKKLPEHSIITVYDLSGKVVFHGLGDGEMKIETGDLNGIYIISAETGRKRLQGKIACF